MIDFAHAVPVDGDGELGEGPAEAPGDKGYLYGANNVRMIRTYVTHTVLYFFRMYVWMYTLCHIMLGVFFPPQVKVTLVYVVSGVGM